MSTVSVVIPCHNGWDMVGRAIRSVRAQRGCEVQLVMVDDGSRVPMPADLREAAGPELVLIRHETAQRACMARNAGIAAADGEWIAFLDHDDYWAPHKLTEQLTALAAAPGCEWAYTNAVIVDEQTRPMDTQIANDPLAVRRELRHFNSVPGGGSAVIARAALVRELGGFEPTCNLFGDWEMWLRLAHATAPAHVPELLTAYMQHGSSLSSRTDLVVVEIERMRAKHAETGLIDADWQRVNTWIADRDRTAGRRLAPARLWMSEAIRYRRPRAAIRALETLISPQRVNARRRRNAARLFTEHPHLREWLTDAAAPARFAPSAHDLQGN